MKKIRIKQIDAFTTIPFGGNPAGVVTDAVGLTPEEMQKIAKEMNLSETTFVFPPNDTRADYLVRFFTPQSELALAGHPTIATVHALIEEGRVKFNGDHHTIWQETKAGVLPVEIKHQPDGSYTIVMTQAVPQFVNVDLPWEEAAKMLGTDAASLDTRYPIQKVSTGIYWLIVPLKTLSAVQNLRPDLMAIADLSRREKITGITVFTTETEDPQCQLHARTFAPNEGVPEDPVCGTGNGCLGSYVVENKVIPCGGGRVDLITEQGMEIGRPGRVYITVEGVPQKITKVQIGGSAVTVLEGEMRF